MAPHLAVEEVGQGFDSVSRPAVTSGGDVTHLRRQQFVVVQVTENGLQTLEPGHRPAQPHTTEVLRQFDGVTELLHRHADAMEPIGSVYDPGSLERFDQRHAPTLEPVTEGTSETAPGIAVRGSSRGVGHQTPHLVERHVVDRLPHRGERLRPSRTQDVEHGGRGRRVGTGLGDESIEPESRDVEFADRTQTACQAPHLLPESFHLVSTIVPREQRQEFTQAPARHARLMHPLLLAGRRQRKLAGQRQEPFSRQASGIAHRYHRRIYYRNMRPAPG